MDVLTLSHPLAAGSTGLGSAKFPIPPYYISNILKKPKGPRYNFYSDS